MSADKNKDSVPEEMPVVSHSGAHKNDADPKEELKEKENSKITLQSQKGKKVDADPGELSDRPTKE